MNSANGCVTEILHITIFGPGGVFRSFQRWLSVLPGAQGAQALSVRTRLKRNGYRPRTNTHVRVNMALFSMQHCSLTTNNPANYGSIQAVHEGYCDPNVMLLIEKLIKNCESTSRRGSWQDEVKRLEIIQEEQLNS